MKRTNRGWSARHARRLGRAEQRRNERAVDGLGELEELGPGREVAEAPAAGPRRTSRAGAIPRRAPRAGETRPGHVGLTRAQLSRWRS